MLSLYRKVDGSEHPHRGITMHEMPVGANFPGLVFAIGSALIFLLAIPALWYVVAGAAVVGLLIAAGMQIIHGHDTDRSRESFLKL